MEEQTQRKRKYQLGYFSPYVRVMSTGDMYAKCTIQGGKKTRFDFDLRDQELGRWRSAPKYLINAAMEKARALYATGDLCFYECDQDGYQRIAGLRYFNAEEVARLLGPQEQPCPRPQTGAARGEQPVPSLFGED